MCALNARTPGGRDPATKSRVILHATVPDANGNTLLAVHPRAVGRGARIADDRHGAGLRKGDPRRVTTGDALPSPRHERPLDEEEAGPPQPTSRSAAGPCR